MSNMPGEIVLNQTGAGVTPAGFNVLNLGLNNQKIALLGLFAKAFKNNAPLVLPDLSIFDARTEIHRSVPFAGIYAAPRIKRFAAAFGMTILEQDPIETDNGWNCFIHGTERLGRDATQGPAALDGFTCQFFRNLAPEIVNAPVFVKLVKAVFIERQVAMVCQLRIEKDWLAQSQHIAKSEAPQDDYAPSFQEILAKVAKGRPDRHAAIYVVCDEANLPVSKEEIRKTVLREHGIELIWKSDILDEAELAALSLLDLSIIDFEMSVRAPAFVGMSRSTFSNLVAFESFCRTGKQHRGQFLYNAPGPSLARRFDNGAFVNVPSATSPLYARAPLIAGTPDDCQWPARLSVHFSTLGDFTTANTHFPGTRRGALVCGTRGSGAAAIEGFSLEFSSEFPHLLEYRAKLSDGAWTDWVRDGGYAGTKGQNRPLRGFAVRLRGPIGLGHACVCSGSFAGKAALVEADGEAGCYSDGGEALEAMQVVFRPLRHGLA